MQLVRMTVIGLLFGMGHVGIAAAQQRAPARPACRADNAGLTLPAGFCAQVFADSVGQARHLVVAPNGDVFVATADNAGGGVVALRDTTGDGVADLKQKFGPGTGGTGIALKGEWLYFAPNDVVVRYRMPAGSLRPGSAPDTIARNLPNDRSHRAKSIAIGPDGALYVNMGSPSNSCQQKDRELESPGKDPCPELDTRAGVWWFDPDKTGQTQADGRRFATGLRNTVALFSHPRDNQLYGAVHGRDGFLQQWPKLYNEKQSAELPAEILVNLKDGDDYGWPYCYYDQTTKENVLNPEYGGDGKRAGRCAQVQKPLMGFPGHWAPNGGAFYTGTQFPATYRDGLFIAFHGSWNRAPLPQDGYRVVFAPFANGKPAGTYQTFADGFRGAGAAGDDAAHRPVGLAVGPDGSLYIADDKAGRIYRVVHRGAR